MCRALYKRGFEPPTSQSISKEKSRNIANIGIQSYITKFSQKCFILSVYYTALCTERFEPPPSLSRSQKKLGHIVNFNIWSCNLKFSEKTVLYFHFTELCYIQGARKKLKIAFFTDILKDFGYMLQLSVFHTMLLNLVFHTSFFTLCLLSCIVLCAECASNKALNHLHRARLRKN